MMKLTDTQAKNLIIDKVFLSNLLLFLGLCSLALVHGKSESRSESRVVTADAIVFPSDDHEGGSYRRPVIRSTTTQKSPIPDDKSINVNDNLIPLEFIQQLSNYSVSDLLLHYVDDYEEDTVIASRFGEDVERSPAQTPKSAACIPELQTIKLVEQTDPSIINIPSCTRIERCGGCCSHKLLSCQPKETEIVSFKVIQTRFAPGDRLKFVGKDVVHVEKHIKCHCDCKTKPSDCTAVQEYRADECSCVCANKDEERKCHKESNKKLWDPNSCSCACRQISNCSSGFQFDGNLCKCVEIPVRRRYVQYQKNRGISNPYIKEQEVNADDYQVTVDEYDF